MPPSKTLPQVFIIIPQADRNCPISRTAFSEDIFSWAERGAEGYVVEKITKFNKGIGHKFW